jgi:hypothetical protein
LILLQESVSGKAIFSWGEMKFRKASEFLHREELGDHPHHPLNPPNSCIQDKFDFKMTVYLSELGIHPTGTGRPGVWRSSAPGKNSKSVRRSVKYPKGSINACMRSAIVQECKSAKARKCLK